VILDKLLRIQSILLNLQYDGKIIIRLLVQSVKHNVCLYFNSTLYWVNWSNGCLFGLYWICHLFSFLEQQQKTFKNIYRQSLSMKIDAVKILAIYIAYPLRKFMQPIFQCSPKTYINKKQLNLQFVQMFYVVNVSGKCIVFIFLAPSSKYTDLVSPRHSMFRSRMARIIKDMLSSN
jgi:hypothetical protein